MDTALYERGKQLLETKMDGHRKAGRLEEMGSIGEADLAEILRRDAPAEKQRQRRKSTAKSTLAKSKASSEEKGEAGASTLLKP